MHRYSYLYSEQVSFYFFVLLMFCQPLSNMHLSFTAFALLSGLVDAQQAWKAGQAVKTTSGNVVGQASGWKTEVSEYLGVPFALPPVGDLRWAAPQPIKDGSKTINATKFVGTLISPF
jgi:hypothetical protein